jgi:hypothetical protein
MTRNTRRIDSVDSVLTTHPYHHTHHTNHGRYYQHTGFNKSEFLQSVARFFLRLKKGEPVPRVGGGGHVEHHAETLDDMSLKLHDDSVSKPSQAKPSQAKPSQATRLAPLSETPLFRNSNPASLPGRLAAGGARLPRRRCLTLTHTVAPLSHGL